jgi:hypothetical protein
MLYRLINETRVQQCPQNGMVDGRAISNLPRYLQNNPEIAKAEGYKELIVSDKPEIDNETQYLTVTYENSENAIIKNWVVNDVPPMPESLIDNEVTN